MLLELAFERGGAVVRRGFGGSGALGGLLGLLGLLVALLREPVDLGSMFCGLIGCGARIVLRGLELSLESADPVAGTLRILGRRGPCLLEFNSELLGAAAVVGGFGGGDVDEGLEIGGGGGRLFRLFLEPSVKGLELRFADRGRCFGVGGTSAGLTDTGASLLKFGLELVGAVAVLVELLGEPVDLGAALLGHIFGGACVALDACEHGFDLGNACGGAFFGGGCGGPGLLEVARELVSAVAVLGGFGGGDVDERLEVCGGGR